MSWNPSSGVPQQSAAYRRMVLVAAWVVGTVAIAFLVSCHGSGSPDAAMDSGMASRSTVASASAGSVDTTVSPTVGGSGQAPMSMPGTAASADSNPSATTPAGARTAVSVTDLVDRSPGPPDVRYTLTAERAKVHLAGGRVVDAWTFNGTAPGPQLRVRVGQIVQVTLENKDIAEGVTIHWHGLDVPNAMDGVAGVTQNAVKPGQRFVYRFTPEQVGTFWYHSHQDSAREVGLGLFGALVVLPRSGGVRQASDIPVVAHTWSAPDTTDETSIGTATGNTRLTMPAGRSVRFRLINTDNLPQRWTVVGADFRVAAIDGNDVHQPGILRTALLVLPAGGRYDVVLTMPARPVLLTDLDENSPGILLVPAGSRAVSPAVGHVGKTFDPLTYGTPAAVPFSATSHFDGSFDEVLETHHAFRHGLPVQWWTINGQLYPNVPMIMVREDQLIRIHIINSSDTIHPMHLHGHRVLVLSRNGKPSTGSPWWADTIEMDPGDDVVVAFRADNPGIWMDHCHNLQHAAAGMMLHVQYEGITTPFSMDPASGNMPE